MRIRQVRPEFFSDPTVARLTVATRLTYIGLWCVADDAGWLVWDVANIGALLSPYESVRVRETRIAKAGAELIESGRMVLHPCSCALIPRLSDHQKIGGNKSFTVRDKHRVHTSMDKSAGKVSNVKVGNVRVIAPAGATDEGTTDEELMAAFRRQGLPVEAVR
jgi:hypothetical protein